MRKMNRCRVCGCDSLYLGGGFSFFPSICCDKTVKENRAARKKGHK